MDRTRGKIDSLVNKYLEYKVFTGCSVGVFHKDGRGESAELHYYGSAGPKQEEITLDKDAYFDLASLTKPLVTSLSLLSLIEEGRCHVDDSLEFHMGGEVPADKKAVTLHQLLTHSSGLPAHKPYYKKLVGLPQKRRWRQLIDWILAEKLDYAPGTATVYSDLGFLLLGYLVERFTGESLDCYWQRKILAPLQLEKGLFFAVHGQEKGKVYVPTGSCVWSNKSLYGVVHDDNCRSLGGVAGHAGLFGTAEGVLQLCRELLLHYYGQGSHPALSRENLKKILKRRVGPWSFGFDSPTPPLSSSGQYFTGNTIGHLGFTGTSFWMDLEQGIIIVLLTNRVFCGQQPAAIKRFRVELHDTVMEEILTGRG